MKANLQPGLDCIAEGPTEEQLETRANPHLLPLVKLPDRLGMGGRARVQEQIGGCPMTCNLAESGVYRAQPNLKPLIAGCSSYGPPCLAAKAQAGKGRLGGPNPLTKGRIFVNKGEISVVPTICFGSLDNTKK